MQFLSSGFVVMLFHYDGNVDEWMQFQWNDLVIYVSAVNQTKCCLSDIQSKNFGFTYCSGNISYCFRVFSSALVQGATNVFWYDISLCWLYMVDYMKLVVGGFWNGFAYLLEDVALEPTRSSEICIFYFQGFFYNSGRLSGKEFSTPETINCKFFCNVLIHAIDKLERFLRHFPVFPNAFLVVGPADFFVIELADQLQKLKMEPVLLHYFSHIKVLQGIELRMATSTRLKTCLYSFTSPGGPMYPTRVVRHAAWDALDLLFPIGNKLKKFATCKYVTYLSGA
ncbi:uncharacterized protein LOC133742768 [Rosa rugosa]|uniref:uncharacterized protein LOC133742768 n=1 Tax=Rosa rugosa TaxID=74645 RepID=UPI002B404405|nr:uncharacterized protein LOC133742768 [Rosa rugosa]